MSTEKRRTKGDRTRRRRLLLREASMGACLRRYSRTFSRFSAYADYCLRTDTIRRVLILGSKGLTAAYTGPWTRSSKVPGPAVVSIGLICFHMGLLAASYTSRSDAAVTFCGSVELGLPHPRPRCPAQGPNNTFPHHHYLDEELHPSLEHRTYTHTRTLSRPTSEQFKHGARQTNHGGRLSPRGHGTKPKPVPMAKPMPKPEDKTKVNRGTKPSTKAKPVKRV
ncbi:hypothetical protein FA13DRAFT_1783239 [Coprinellus micaceus]|uniref:Uncharacterized protein n=1 Tax=Coprinellus micaceus TaxID=71717 RepID=A0A4Y7RMG1_COPMI|nr:hypothetical protein FA13DRAFT_1783239 [Coprinellus micaceus]